METRPHNHLDLDAIKDKLAQARGPQYWRTLGELAETPDFIQSLIDEVPQASRTAHLHLDRRQFLTLAGASLALAGLSGCRFLPQQKLVPYVRQPEESVVGIPLYYATVVPGGFGYGIGAIVTSREGRPIKIEGNPLHPDSLGATDAITQASLLSLYDPDRSQTVIHKGEFSSWSEFYDIARPALERIRTAGGAGLSILTETVNSPTLAAQIAQAKAQFPGARWAQYEPLSKNSARHASQIAFKQYVDTRYDLTKAKRIVSLDADFLLTSPGHVRYAHDFVAGRKIRSGTTDLNRLYVIESAPTITGAMADHRISVRPSQVEVLARGIAAGLGLSSVTAPALDAQTQKEITVLVQDLQANPGTSVVIPGDFQVPEVHVLAHAINEKLNNIGQTVFHTEPVEAAPIDQISSLQDLINDMNAGKVELLLILGGNPVYNAPANLNFMAALDKVPFRVHLGQYEDETSHACQWHLPETHYLEAWGDLRAFDGTASIVQPLIQPLYDSKSANEVLSGLFDAVSTTAAPETRARDGFSILRDYWAANGYPLQQPYDLDFNKLLHDGVIPNTAAKGVTPVLDPGALTGLLPLSTASPKNGAMELAIRPDPTIWDGRYANNGWLQELPKPLTKVTWDNVAFVSPDTSLKLIKEFDAEQAHTSHLVEITLGGGKVIAPLWALPGHPDDTITLQFGYGRKQAGQIGNGIGYDAYPLHLTNVPAFGFANVAVTDGTYDIAVTQHHLLTKGSEDPNAGAQEAADRDIIRSGTISQFLKRPSLAMDAEPIEGKGEQNSTVDPLHNVGTSSVNEKDMGRALDQPNLYPSKDHVWPKNPKDPTDRFGAYAWGMSIDIQSCIGCNACLVACQSENNIPVIGKEQVMRGRHMNWIRIDTYYKSDPANHQTYYQNPEVYFQPLMCVQCEQAPCEPVCPVAATVHSEEGLNQMVYNRCIGTKYCSNNCPYKVRRFNFLNYNNHFDVGTRLMVFNPEVTVRGRGVMEKCMYCVQRINFARQTAKQEGREVRDGEIVTACQQACPTEAIVFGNINDPNSKVSELKNQPHNYGLLADLNTRPRTTFLGRVTNPNHDIAPETEPKVG